MQNRYQCPDCHKPLFEDHVHKCYAQTIQLQSYTFSSDERSEKSSTFHAHERLEKSDKANKPVTTF
jgi:hypothetical protein